MAKTNIHANKKLITPVIMFSAFLAGMLIYLMVSIALSKLVPSAGAVDGAWHQVTVLTESCNCITEFKPSPSLPGSGTVDDPYVSNNSTVVIGVGSVGVGLITIEDENGKVLYSYNQTSNGIERRDVIIQFPDSTGTHHLTIKVDGTVNNAVGVSGDIYVRIDTLPPILPLPPNTGVVVFIAGYAVEMYSLLLSGALGSLIAFMVIAKRRERNNKQRRTS